MQRTVTAVLFVGGLLLACSSSSDNSSPSPTSSSPGNTPVSTADCQDRCKAKATSCNAPASDAEQGCQQICSGSITSGQITCLENKSCSELGKATSLESICPKSGSTSSGGPPPPPSGTGTGSSLGGPCTCTNTTPQSEGYCAGSDVGCKTGLGCLYDVGSNGKGQCVGARCCENTSACDKDHSLLQPCDQGTCTKANLGYWCMK